MGMDVYGRAADDKVGEYFRANIWWWRRLWEFCEDIAPDLIPDDNLGHSNDGWGLPKTKARELAQRLKDSQPAAKIMADALAAHIAALPRSMCRWCNGTGIRTDEVGVKAGMPTKPNSLTGQMGWCNACDGKGDTDPVDAMYPFSPEFTLEFAEFLEHSGGFEIW